MAISSDDYRSILMRKCYTCEILGRPLCEKRLRVCLEIADLESNSRSAISRISSQSKTRRRRYYVRPAHSDRLDMRFLSFDDYLASLDHKQFHEYTRLTPQEFDELHSRIAPRLEHRKCHRFPVSSIHRLAVTMRFLGHGSAFDALAHEVRLGTATVMKIVYECCRAIKDELWSDTFPTPTAADWHQSAEQFRRLWSYPRAVASIDGKHFRCNVLHNLLANRLTPQQMLQRYPPPAAINVESDGRYSRAPLRTNAQRQRSIMNDDVLLFTTVFTTVLLWFSSVDIDLLSSTVESDMMLADV
ncbi:unnamed protein product [Nippostrongylus brasiliensis]|uniref:DDE Tnp4 domain-containing protein n=1 Tax=Nippostrongylus brasiliensis TaxID=27835 RepID=A0A0N4YXD4_NIPBR|nr:unnamed protein product [Nippostrongylus brasiliensis]